MKKVVIYTGDRCIHCDWAIDLLNRKNIKFTEYNEAKDITKREEIIRGLVKRSESSYTTCVLCISNCR